MSFLVDTNILLRSVQPSHPMHAPAVRSLATLIGQGQSLTVAVQNMAEFWNVATRPMAYQGLGFTTEEAQQELNRLERYFRVLSESASSYAEWKRIVVTDRVSGVQVHDARLVAVMRTHGIRELLTFNVQDFERFKEIEAVHPEEVV